MRKPFHTSESQVWFTADLHFGHEGMIDKCYRPFQSVDDMDMTLIRNWNTCVDKRDHVFVLGDFSFRSNERTLWILSLLKGTKYLIEGNHDRRRNKAIEAMWEGGIEKYHEIDVDGQRIVMCHFAFRSWNKMHYGSWNLHGHSHGNLSPIGKQMDVGVDAVAKELFPDGGARPSAFAPISFPNIAALMKTAPFVAVDHHTPKVADDGALVTP